MGQEFAQEREWSEERSLDWELLEKPEHKQFQNYVKALWKFYKEQPALFELDYDPDGFEWINHMESEKNMLTFIRKSKKKEDTLIIVCNFSTLTYEKYQMGVPYPGKYKEIFNSDDKEFGGSGVRNARAKTSKKAEADERKDSIVIDVAPLSIQIFSYSKAERKTAAKKTAAKPAVSKVRTELEKKIEEERIKELEQQKAKLEQAQKAEVKPEVKKLAAKPEAEKIEAKPEAKKIGAKPEAEKIEAKPEAKKIGAKPEAEKIEAKPEAKKISAKPEAEKIEAKPEVEKITAKPVTEKKPARAAKKTSSKKPAKKK